MSKGSKPRPIENKDQFFENWDKIFKKKDCTEEVCYKQIKDGEESCSKCYDSTD